MTRVLTTIERRQLEKELRKERDRQRQLEGKRRALQDRLDFEKGFTEADYYAALAELGE